MNLLLIFVAIAIIILFILIALKYSDRSSNNSDITVYGGSRLSNDHIVIDTLNLLHLVFESDKLGKVVVNEDIIYRTIEISAPVITKKYSGRVMYVIKGKDKIQTDENTDQTETDADSEKKYNRLQELCNKYKIYIYYIEQYKDPPKGHKMSAAHASKGRDDFYLMMLANRYKCKILSEDRYRDFGQFNDTIPPFYVYEFTFWALEKKKDFVNPAQITKRGSMRIRKAPRVSYLDL